MEAYFLMSLNTSKISIDWVALQENIKRFETDFIKTSFITNIKVGGVVHRRSARVTLTERRTFIKTLPPSLNRWVFIPEFCVLLTCCIRILIIMSPLGDYSNISRITVFLAVVGKEWCKIFWSSSRYLHRKILYWIYFSWIYVEKNFSLGAMM